MQNFMHIRTLFLSTSVFGLILFVCMFNIVRTRQTYAGFNYWTVAALCYFLGNALIGLRGMIPDLFSIVVANTMVTATMVVVPYGFSLFVGKKDPAWPYLFATASAAILLAYWTYLSPDIGVRIVLVSLAHGLSCLYCAYRIRRDIPALFAKHNYLLEFSFTAGGIWAFFRLGYTAFFDKNVQSVLHPTPTTSITLIVYCVLFSFIALGLCLLNFQRTEHDLVNATDEVKRLTGFLPICSGCKKIRDDQGYWSQVETYIKTHTEAVCTHSLCPECAEKMYPQYYKQAPAEEAAENVPPDKKP